MFTLIFNHPKEFCRFEEDGVEEDEVAFSD